jgi:DNA-directed DNA polymerase III PolC
MYLNVHSQYSLRYGVLTIDKIVELATLHGVEQLALTDINNSTGCMEFVRACRRADIKPVVGIEFRRNHRLLYICIAKNREGFRELNEFLSHHNLNKLELPDRPFQFSHAYVVYEYGNEPSQLRENEFIGIRAHQLNKLFGKPLQALRPKLLALHPVTVNTKHEAGLHTYLRAIDLNTLLTKITDADQCREDEVMLSPWELAKNFRDYPYVLENTKKLLEGCSIDVDLTTPKNKKIFTSSRMDDIAFLNKLAYDGCESRYGNSRAALKRIQEELQVIEQLDFAANFLITHDFVRHGMGKGFYHVGRGSGACSVVAYCLRITDVDPIELDLYFERFLNVKRTSPPDFDIDYSWDERDEMHDYIFKRYGRQYTALLGTMSLFKERSAMREFGKVLGIPKPEIDQFVDPSKDATNRRNPMFKKLVALQKFMGEVPNQRSIHAGGVLISEEPITYYTALDLPPKGLPTVQWDMYEAEEIGYEKFDVLSQRGIGHIKEAVRVIEHNHGKKVNVHNIKALKKDPKINELLRTGNTIGGFYGESPGMRGLLRKTSCDNYLLLVAVSSIIRPGVAQSGMMRAFIERLHDPSKIEYLHPVMKELLEETYGVMVYQEDVIKVCHHYAGLSLADSDVLRRAMSGKFRSKAEFNKLVEQYFTKAKALNRDETVTKEIWRQVSSFAGYSFCKAHSASFAVETYQSLFLKAYYPREFMVAVLNNYGGFYRRWVYVHQLQKAGATVHLPCVNNSESVVCIRGKESWLGFVGIQGLEQKIIPVIVNDRLANGAFLDLEDFIKRTCITLEQCKILIRIGALRFTGKNKKDLLWEVYNYLGQKPVDSPTPELFAAPKVDFVLPALQQTSLEDAYDEIELLGFPLTLSMFDLIKTKYRGDIMAKDLMQHVGQTVKMLGSFVVDKPVHTVKGTTMYFGTFLDATGEWFDTVHFPGSFNYSPFQGRGCYLILGKVVQEFGFPSVEVQRCERLPIIQRTVEHQKI